MQVCDLSLYDTNYIENKGGGATLSLEGHRFSAASWGKSEPQIQSVGERGLK